MACTSAHTRLPESIYNLALLLPTLGVGPSAVLTLLSSSTKEDHAVANGCFIMMRSLGVFVAVAAGTTTLQNVFEGAVATAQQTIEGSSQEVCTRCSNLFFGSTPKRDIGLLTPKFRST